MLFYFLQGHKKNDSITSTSSSGGSQFYYEIANSAPNSRNNSLDRGVSPPGEWIKLIAIILFLEHIKRLIH